MAKKSNNQPSLIITYLESGNIKIVPSDPTNYVVEHAVFPYNRYSEVILKASSKEAKAPEKYYRAVLINAD